MDRYKDEELRSALLQQMEENLRRAYSVPAESLPQQLQSLMRQLGEKLAAARQAAEDAGGGAPS